MSNATSDEEQLRRQRRSQTLARCLAIVECQVGRGEEVPPGEWDELRRMAAGYKGGPEVVASLESVVRKCEDQLQARIRAGDADPERLRAGLMRFIRALMEKKFGVIGSEPPSGQIP